MERKRQREKKRRLEISCSVDRLTKSIVKVDPGIFNTTSSTSSSDRDGSLSSMNRNDLINIACDVIERLNDEVRLLREEKKKAKILAKPHTPKNKAATTAPSDEDEHQQQQKGIISSSTKSAAAGTAPSRNDQEAPRRPRPISGISDWNSFNARSQYVSSETSNNVASDHAMALLVLQQQQKQQAQQVDPGSSCFATAGAGGGSWPMRPTPGGSGSGSSPPSLGARFLQHQAADVSHLQQIRKKDMLQQSSQHEELLLQQLRYQQNIQEILQRQEMSASMHPRVSYHPSRVHAQGRVVPALVMGQPAAGNAAFAAAAGFENVGGLTAASVVVPSGTSAPSAMMSSSGAPGISFDDVPPSMYPMYARRNLQQQGQEGHSFH